MIALTSILILALTPLSFAQGRTWRTTEAMYENVIEAYPTVAMAYNNLAAALIRRGKAEEAYPYLEKAIEYDIELTPAHVYLGNYYREQGDLERAIAEYELSIEYASQWKELPNDEFLAGFFLLGEVFEEQGKNDEALALFEEAARRGDQFARAHYNLAVTYHERGRLLEAADEYRKTIELDDQYIDAHYNVAAIYGETGQLALSIKELEYVLAIDPTHPKAKQHLENMKKMQ